MEWIFLLARDMGCYLMLSDAVGTFSLGLGFDCGIDRACIGDLKLGGARSFPLK